MNDEKFFDNSQFLVSFQLLKLFHWLVEHEQESLKKIIARCFTQGFDREVEDLSLVDQEIYNENLQEGVLDFFSLLEVLLQEVQEEKIEKEFFQRTQIPEINNIDGSICDAQTLAASVAKVASVLKANPTAHAKETLCRELLKQWNPKSKSDS